jgi:hypothetical protein
VRDGFKIASPQETSSDRGCIDAQLLSTPAASFGRSNYDQDLRSRLASQ